MAKRSVMTESEVKAIVQAEIQNADGYSATRVSNERADNLNSYFGRPYGNEIEGRSKVVSRDVQQTVEWQIPSFMRVFTSGEDIVSFEPSNANDIDKAKQATEYVNFIWTRDNPGYRILYEWTKDGLISKNGIIKIWWDDTPKTKRERYSGLDDQTFAQLVADKDVKVAEHTETEQQILAPGPDGQMQPVEATFHDVVITRTIPGGKVCIENMPPEEFLISKEGRDIEDARLVGHRKLRTLSDLIQDGFDKDKVNSLGLSGSESLTGDVEQIARNTVEDPTTHSDEAMNKAMSQVWVTEAYIKIDVDGDGIAEMRKVTVAGPGFTVLSNDAWDGRRPFATWTPIIMPHRFWGTCPADQSKDTQLVKTTMLRQFLDNVYVSTNPREEVIADRIVDVDELLDTAPGRKIRVTQGNGPAITPIPVQNVGPQLLEALHYVDSINEANTGSSDRTQGLSSDTLSNETKAQSQMLMTAAMGKQELMVRTLAETGLKDAFKLILDLVVRYQDKPRTIRLTGGWVEMDPSQWDPDMDMKVSVGMGMGDRDHQIMASQMVSKGQQMILPLGYITPENIKNSFELGINGLGMKGVDRFATFPQGEDAKKPIQLPPPHHGPDPQTLMQIEQAKGQAKVQVATVTAQARAQTDQAKIAAKAQGDQALNQVELQRHSLENHQAMQMEAFKAKVEGAIALATAHIRAAAQIEAARITASMDDGAEAEARESSQEAA